MGACGKVQTRETKLDLLNLVTLATLSKRSAQGPGEAFVIAHSSMAHGPDELPMELRGLLM